VSTFQHHAVGAFADGTQVFVVFHVCVLSVVAGGGKEIERRGS
jgi:hypothetical protein